MSTTRDQGYRIQPSKAKKPRQPQPIPPKVLLKARGTGTMHSIPERAQLLDLYCERASQNRCLWTGDELPRRYEESERVYVARALAGHPEGLQFDSIQRRIGRGVGWERLSWVLLSDWFDYTSETRIQPDGRVGRFNGVYRLSDVGRQGLAVAERDREAS